MIFNNINLGITSKCNAKCKYCNRHTFKDSPYINQDMSIKTFEKIYPFTRHIEFCGSYGDFINHPKGLEFLYIAKSNNVTFNVETNAGINDENYWKELANICNSKDHFVQFSIDDIEHEFNPYRGVKTKVVLDNLQKFISFGGYAIVKTILFSFNEFQDIKSEMMKLGVKKHIEQYSMIYESGKLEAPSHCKYKDGTLKYLYDISSKINIPPKKCPWDEGKWLYIFDNGELHQCCNLVIHSVDLEDSLPKVGEYTNINEYGELYDVYLKNKDLINLNNNDVTFESAYNNEYNEYVRKNYKNITRCKRRCSIFNFISEPITGILK
jgi:MoaA/NifB/PqqE/SkfB family radical SAM enzyme